MLRFEPKQSDSRAHNINFGDAYRVKIGGGEGGQRAWLIYIYGKQPGVEYLHKNQSYLPKDWKSNSSWISLLTFQISGLHCHLVQTEHFAECES